MSYDDKKMQSDLSKASKAQFDREKKESKYVVLEPNWSLEFEFAVRTLEDIVEFARGHNSTQMRQALAMMKYGQRLYDEKNHKIMTAQTPRPNEFNLREM